MSNVVPEGWNVDRLGDLTNLITKGTTPKSYSNDGVNFIKIESISFRRTLIQKKFSKIEFNTHESQKRSQLQFGDILFGIAGSLGRLAVVKEGDLPANTNQALAIIRLRQGSVDRDFCVQQLSADKVQLEIKNIQTVGAQPNLSLQQVSDFELYIPPLPEQKKIASILNSVDEVIEHTQKQIDKLQDLKKATMNELLTKGINHTKFKNSELGQIPKSWEVRSINDVCKVSSGGTPDRSKSEYWNGGIPWVKTGEVNYSVIYSTEEMITQQGMRHSSAKLISKGAVLLAMYGQGLTRGRVAVLGVDATMNQACLSLMPTDDVFNVYLYYFFYQQYENLRNLVQEGAQKNLSAGIIKEIYIPTPPLPEQERISSILSSIDFQVEQKQQKLHQTQSLKKSLMQDLLTGKVRV